MSARRLFCSCRDRAPSFLRLCPSGRILGFRQPRLVSVGLPVAWTRLVHPSSIPRNSSCTIDFGALREICYVFRASALNQLWAQRNATVFDHLRPHSLIQHVFKLHTTFAAHLRYIRRQDSIPSGSLNQVVAVLRTASCSGVVFDVVPRPLATRDIAQFVPLHLLRGISGCSP